MFEMFGHIFAQKTLVKIPNHGQTLSSQNFTIALQNRPMPKLLSFSGNTFHSITGISNFEVWALKNSVKALLNSLTET
jgi:hypothetical protein